MMRISARTHYALRAMVVLAATDGPVRAEHISASQDIPRRFCDDILLQLRRSGLINSQRGPDGGYWLARPAEKISLADVIRVTEGVETGVGHFPGVARPLAEVWDEIRQHENALLSEITLAHIVATATDPSPTDLGPNRRRTRLTPDPADPARARGRACPTCATRAHGRPMPGGTEPMG
ncbi:RrF2 family transcriptional regulator [Nonomuraea cavernae]|uniref:Transcriptional regulator n=1 Tax=Nonomuraea cavernae TaxID=2045107 RepID=A0A917YS02_9ACTN|nr:Rrf2 family transcriptional regulator [Nonomuraea cavernae]MCA2184564.1 Rrf2 family transcriptional regulator [Nonomuraea cavernae]GGO63409.1 hypothetical protein GCM10012289_10400 [Nonomuraea cavernae]